MSEKKICLGTALWGWSVSESEAFAILDYFYAQGGRAVDSAYNYPLNGVTADFLKSTKFLSAWIKERKVQDLKIIYKIGSLSNERSESIDLSPASIQKNYEDALKYFGSNLDTLMIHWDHRDDESEIEKTCRVLGGLSTVQLGLSGIRFPKSYVKPLSDLGQTNFHIQTKFNFRDSGLEVYEPLLKFQPQMWAYGIGLGGIKTDPVQYQSSSYVSLARKQSYHQDMMPEKLKIAITETLDRNPDLKNIYQMAIAFACNEKRLAGFLIGASRLSQIQDTMKFIAEMKSLKLDLTLLHTWKN